MIINLPCKPFVADYMRAHFGDKLRIIDKSHEATHLKLLIRTGSFEVYRQGFTERYGRSFPVEFPNLFIFKAGKVGIPSSAAMDFNTFVRDRLAELMNDHLDQVDDYVDAKESDMIFSYLVAKGIHPDSINMDTWKKIRLRYKVEQNGGPLRKKEPAQNVFEIPKMSLKHG